MSSDELSIEARLGAPPPRVYHALTDPGALRSWLAEHAASAPERREYAFWGRHTPQGEIGRQTLVAAEEDRRLVFAWTLDDQRTTVELRLEPYGADGTTLRFRQDKMPTLEELMAPPGRRDGRHSMHTFWGLAVANLAEYVEGRPLTPKADFGPARPREIRAEVVIGASPEEVFASLVDPARIRRWFGWEAEVEPRVGGRMTLGLEGEISAFEPGKQLVYGDGEGTVVNWELAGSEGRTFLTFVQSGYSEDELDSAAQHEAGWLGGIAELKRMHELGDAWTPLITELPGTEEGEPT
ncbi:SRPBCC domain-containing protein [Actinomadura rugatobispora]|uniref:SRPBCC domain-containing protein n=1 Tax=Actinomadura rugatobispora TaxID=1994 RepID=A0ABW1AAC7_9ACTN|nr:hypothetical protein GCM10010200_046010 [Actinomadura rugatobispora]